jgi:uncharacterized phiE125 gp8 family phage protein
MTVSYRVTVPAVVEPVTVAEMKAHARIDLSAEDTLCATYIKAATDKCEQRLGRPVCEQTIVRTSADFPSGFAAIELARTPVISVTSVKYRDDNGALQTLSLATYELDTSDEHGPAWVALKPNQTWPTTGDYRDAVQVTYRAGWPDGQVPAAIAAWVLLAATWLFENRTSGDLPHDFGEALLASRRLWVW